jgi:protein-tyrosine phosphatase
MAEGLLRHRLDPADVEVRSAGILPGGVAASAPGVEVLAARGIDLSAHLSRTMASDEIAAADLVVGMERRHVQEAVVRVPGAEAWSFTLRDLVARAEAADPRRQGESLRAWAGRLAAGRPRSALLGVGDDAVADPIGQPRAAYERTALELDDLLARLAARAWPRSVLAPGSAAGATDPGARTAREAS